MTRPIRHACIAAFALAFATVPALAKDVVKKADAAPAKNVAVVNGKSIPIDRASAILATVMAQGQPDTPELRNSIREDLVRREVLMQEAQKKGFDKKPEIQMQMDYARQEVLVRAFVGDYVNTHPITDEAVKKEYDAVVAATGNKDYKARHILVEKEDEAKTIIDKLNKGEKFEDLAKQSLDPGSKDRGGDLDWAIPANYVKPFADALVKLEKGKYTEAPVKTNFGYHVIQLTDTRERKAPALDEIKPRIVQHLQQKVVDQMIGDLVRKAKIE